jgi:hypothetical protein
LSGLVATLFPPGLGADSDFLQDGANRITVSNNTIDILTLDLAKLLCISYFPFQNAINVPFSVTTTIRQHRLHRRRTTTQPQHSIVFTSPSQEAVLKFMGVLCEDLNIFCRVGLGRPSRGRRIQSSVQSDDFHILV